MKKSSPHFGFLASLCTLTLLVSAVSFARSDTESSLPEVPKLLNYQEDILLSPKAQYAATGNQLRLDSGRLYLNPRGKAYQVSNTLGQVEAKEGEFFIDAASGRFTVAVERGQAFLQVPDEKVTRLSTGLIAQLAEPYSEGEGPINFLGMDEGIDDPLRALAFAEPGTILSTLALSEAAVGSSLLLPVLGGAAAAAGAAATVSSLLDAEEGDDTPPPISQ